MRGRVKAARALVSRTPGLAETLASDWQKAAKFYARFGITENSFRHGLQARVCEPDRPIAAYPRKVLPSLEPDLSRGTVRPRFVGILAVAVVLIVAISAFLLLMGSSPGGSASVTPCRFFRFFLSPLLVPPGQTVLVGSSGINLSNAPGPAPQWRFSIYANSTTPYVLYLLSQDQYSSYTASGSGTTPPSSYYWESGIETATNTTVLVANGIWYPMAYNPGTARAIVTVQTAQCGVTP